MDEQPPSAMGTSTMATSTAVTGPSRFKGSFDGDRFEWDVSVIDQCRARHDADITTSHNTISSGIPK
jgi:hypothetical protein